MMNKRHIPWYIAGTAHLIIVIATLGMLNLFGSPQDGYHTRVYFTTLVAYHTFISLRCFINTIE